MSNPFTTIDASKGNPWDENSPGGDTVPFAGPSPAIKAWWAAEEKALARLGQWAHSQVAAGNAVHWDRNNADGCDIAPAATAELAAVSAKLAEMLTPLAEAAGMSRDASASEFTRQGERRLRDAARWAWEDRVLVHAPQHKTPRWF